jgi:hypothetical protein
MTIGTEPSEQLGLETLPLQGGVYGFDVRSTLRFDGLRAAGGGAALEIETFHVDGPAADHDLVAEIRQPGFLARIYRADSRYLMWVEAIGWFEVNPRERRILVPPSTEEVLREELLWGVPTLLCFLERGDLSLHAASVEVDGKAIVLMAHGARGKSTLAAAFAQRGHRVLAEDLTCITYGGGPACVVPGPATLRLRGDVASRLDVPSARRLPGADRARFALDRATRGDCNPVPVGALVLLARDDDGISLREVDRHAVLRDLWQLSFRLTREHDRSCFEHIVDLAHDGPVVSLHRPLRLDALAPTVETLLSALG